jgi:hypothetical protein
MRFSVAAAVLLAGCGLFAVGPAALAGASGQAAVVTTAQQPSAAVTIETAIEKEGLAAARAKMEHIDAHPDTYAISERDINNLGYRYLGRRAFPEASAVFEFNVRRFPASGNVYDSLAEASVMAGDEARFEATLKAWLAKLPGDPAVVTRVGRREREACDGERRPLSVRMRAWRVIRICVPAELPPSRPCSTGRPSGARQQRTGAPGRARLPIGPVAVDLRSAEG